MPKLTRIGRASRHAQSQSGFVPSRRLKRMLWTQQVNTVASEENDEDIEENNDDQVQPMAKQQICRFSRDLCSCTLGAILGALLATTAYIHGPGVELLALMQKRANSLLNYSSPLPTDQAVAPMGMSTNISVRKLPPATPSPLITDQAVASMGIGPNISVRALPPATPLSQMIDQDFALKLGPLSPPSMPNSAVHVQVGEQTRLPSLSAPSLWHRFGSSPANAAQNLVRHHLTPAEKASLLQGYGWNGFALQPQFYVGNIHGVPRLDIPSQNSQDASQGFRTRDYNNQHKQVTSFPSALAAASTWDQALVYEYARAIGAEFRAKGANLILGPSVNVHRIARGGRNAEYISGEDGRLGAPLVDAYVQGVQSQGVAAVVKHFVLNNQETNRASQSSDASDRTLWEVYYPPFRAAVDAGAAAVMCSYNKVNGSWACGGHPRLIIGHLRQKMGFQGFVMTDWWALTSNLGARAALNGVDQEMPGKQKNKKPGFFGHHNLVSHGADVDAMATRVLTGLLSSGAFDKGEPSRPTCEPGKNCTNLLYRTIATSTEHVTVARKVAAASTVLLKNANITERQHQRHVLPITRGSRVVLIGEACNMPFLSPREHDWQAADYYTLGGSARVVAAQEVATTILRGLEARARVGDIHRLSIVKNDNVAAAISQMQGHDLAIACGGTTASEGKDRTSLRLDQDRFLRSLASTVSARRRSGASAFPPLLIVALAPGAIVADWAADANAAMIMFLTGQETGHAFADVLFGNVNPSAKLPVTIPATESDVLPPCTTLRCEYSEGLSVGWRYLIGKPVTFPFGHGLSYTSFRYEWAAMPRPLAMESNVSNKAQAVQTFHVIVRNTGAVAGQEVIQLYVQYPDDAGEPANVLRGFQKTELLQPGASSMISMGLIDEDLSVWSGNGDSGHWKRIHGQFVALVASSSRDTRLRHSFMA